MTLATGFIPDVLVAPSVPAAALGLVWGVLGLPVGALVRWGSVRLARLEGLEPGHQPWQVYGPAALMAVLFAAFAVRSGAQPVLLVRSLWVAVLVQVIFFDLEHLLILDRVLLPSSAAAVVLSVATPGLGLVPALLTGAVAGFVFLALAVLGSALFRAEAMGLGDVKLCAFLGLILGPQPTLAAVLLGVVLAGVVAVVLLLFRLRSMRDSIPYGPFLAVGALVALFALA